MADRPEPCTGTPENPHQPVQYTRRSAPADSPLTAPVFPLSLSLKAFQGEELTPAEQAQLDRYTERFREVEARQQALGLVDLADIMENGVVNPTMLVPELLMERAHHLVYGEKESAKTWLFLWCAARLLAESKSVLWIDQEMGSAMFAQRLLTLGIPPALVSEHFVYSEFAMFDCSLEHRALWSALLDLKQPALVVVDAQTEVLAGANLHENLGTDIAKWHMAYMAPALARGASTVMIDHTGHSEQGRAAGSRHKGAQSKIELSIECTKFDRDKTGTMTVKRTKNTPAAPIPEEQTYEVGGDGDGGFTFRTGAAPLTDGHRTAEHRQAALHRKILEAVHGADEPIAKSQLAGTVGGRATNTMKAIDQLVEDGSLTATASGRSLLYELTPQGEAWLILPSSGQGHGSNSQGATT
jgi:hypothetical protein